MKENNKPQDCGDESAVLGSTGDGFTPQPTNQDVSQNEPNKTDRPRNNLHFVPQAGLKMEK